MSHSTPFSLRTRADGLVVNRLVLFAEAGRLATETGLPVPTDVNTALRLVTDHVDAAELELDPASFGLQFSTRVMVITEGHGRQDWQNAPFPDVDAAAVLSHTVAGDADDGEQAA